MDYALSSTEQNDIVFLGDSICRSGVEPRQFESLTELRAYNLGMLFGGLGPDVLTDVAAAYLMKHRRPRMIVLCTSPVCFEKDVPDVYVQLRDRFLRCYAWDLSDLRTFHGSQRCLIGVGYLIRQGVMIGWDRVSCSFIGHRHDVLDDPLDGDAATTFRTLEERTHTSRGFYAMFGSGRQGNLDRPGGLVLIQDGWDRGVRRLATICEKAHVPLMICLGPISAEATTELNFDHVQRWLDNLQRAHSHVTIANPDRVVRYAPDLCADSTHPNVAGARKFTAQLATDLQKALQTERGDQHD